MHTDTSEDLALINEAIRKFFMVFTNKEGRSPDMEMLYDSCIPEVLIVQVKDGAQHVYTIDAFSGSRQKMLTDGTLTEFEERETSAETRISGSIAQRYSKYEKGGILMNIPFQQRGCKLFQLVKQGGLWKISSLIWEDEEPGQATYP